MKFQEKIEDRQRPGCGLSLGQGEQNPCLLLTAKATLPESLNVFECSSITWELKISARLTGFLLGRNNT